MEKQKGNKTRLGILVTVSFILLILAIYFIGSRQQLFSKTMHLSGIFTDISGLQVGNNVRFSGINIGTIDKIEQITDSSVKVDMKILESSGKFLKKDAIAVIGSDGLMGSKILVIIAGSPEGKIVADFDTLKTTMPVSMDDILVNLKVTSENSAEITSDLAAIIKNIRNGNGAIGKLFMDNAFAENMDDAIVNIKQGAGGFKQNMDAAGNSILLRGFMKKKKKKEERAKERAIEQAEKKEIREDKKEIREDKKQTRIEKRAERKEQRIEKREERKADKAGKEE
ncbi:MAG: MlaD family protein [Taibaiella sp.]|nr:MlaD family protein [Taibaiella sp.]